MKRATLSFCAAAILSISAAMAQAQTTARVVGAITAINGSNVTVKTDGGELRQVEVPAGASIKRVEPGQKDLSTAAAIAFSELAVGDRVLIKLDPNASTPQAALVIAIKQEDLARKQQREREDWQRRGVAGLVKSIDPVTGTIVITTGAGPTAKSVTVQTTKATVLKRYAPGSVRFDQAQPGPLDAIQVGDQLRAKGNKNADGTELAAEEVVSGAFRNVAGTISSIDPAASTLTVKDLATKKQVTIHITADAQLHKIPEMMAQMLAVRLRGTAPKGLPAQGQGTMPPGGAMPGGGMSQATGSFPGARGGMQGMANGDPQQMLNRTPTIKLSDLEKGQAVMVVATDGANEVNAVTLLAGVESLLEAPEATNLLSNWSMGGGGAEGAGGTQ